jgi:hypothetical protein
VGEYSLGFSFAPYHTDIFSLCAHCPFQYHIVIPMTSGSNHDVT